MSIKSPFYVIEDFVSPLMCEDILDACDFNVPDQDKEGEEVLTTKTSDRAEAAIFNRLQQIIPDLEKYYELEYKGTERIQFEWFPTGSSSQPQSENAVFVRGKWLRVRNRDLSAILFLTDYQDTPPFEGEYEVYGGKLEFPQHKFGFNPRRGTLVVFPSDPHFINLTSAVFAGDAFQARIQMAAKAPYIYDPTKFQGNYLSWFSGQ